MKALALAAVILCSAAGLGVRYAFHQFTNASNRALADIDPSKTTRRVSLTPNGGTIELSVKTAADRQTMSLIRSALPGLSAWFGTNQFQMPSIGHAKGAPTLTYTAPDASRVKDKVRFAYANTPTGGRVTVTTSDPEALPKVYAFLRSFAGDPSNGDILEISRR